MTKIQERLFYFAVIISYILYGLTLFGLYKKAPKYLYTLNMTMRIYVSLFLILRFNPYVTNTFTEFDRKIAYTSGIFLLLTTTLTDIVINYVKKIDFDFINKNGKNIEIIEMQ